MKKSSLSMLLAAISFFSTLSAAARPAPLSDDRDLAGPVRLRMFGSVPVDLKADRQEIAEDPGGLSLQVLREDHGRLVPVTGLSFSSSFTPVWAVRPTDKFGRAKLNGCDSSSAQIVAAPLKDNRLNVTNGQGTYRVVANVSCRGLVRLIFKQDSDAGQAVGIWQVAHHAEEKLTAEINMDFWRRSITFIWPS